MNSGDEAKKSDDDRYNSDNEAVDELLFDFDDEDDVEGKVPDEAKIIEAKPEESKNEKMTTGPVDIYSTSLPTGLHFMTQKNMGLTADEAEKDLKREHPKYNSFKTPNLYQFNGKF